ncbi:MAG: antitoxin VbhA family protein [Bacilli bacterium]|nr:antitoxin VbhA family protein [Bacilli bacterium]
MNYLIQDTTKEEREALVKKAFLISMSGEYHPSQEALELANDYIEGKRELEEIRKIIVEKYKKEDISS